MAAFVYRMYLLPRLIIFCGEWLFCNKGAGRFGSQTVTDVLPC